MKRLYGVVLALLLILPAVRPAESQVAAIAESPRQVPVAYTVDVVVVGGSTGAVAAAWAAAAEGASVLLIAPRPYLGEDMAGTLRLWLEPDEQPQGMLQEALFRDGRMATPLQVKRTLDNALLGARVQFLYSSMATDVLRDANGRLAGIVMANRAGRQAVVAKMIIDATDRAWVARLAGAQFRPFPAGPQEVKRVIIGTEARRDLDAAVRQVPFQLTEGDTTYNVYEYTLRLPMADGSYASWAKAEQMARDRTYLPSQAKESDMLFAVPPDPMIGEEAAVGDWQGAAQLPIGAFHPAGVEGLYVLGGCADIPREQAEKLLRPLTYMTMGARLGSIVGSEARRLAKPEGVQVAGTGTAPNEGEVREVLVGVRPIQQLPTITQEARALPVLGHYDVVVIGGGVSGAPAGIAAARQGARTLVVEYLYGLGGVGTQGAIASYYYGLRQGFTREVPGEGKWTISERMEWWRTALCQAGADIWMGALGCGAVVKDGRVVGAVVATPQGRGVVLAKVVIDSTGNADVAAAAGAPTVFTDETDIAVQGAGLPALGVKSREMNTDFTLTDETDMIDTWHLLVAAKQRYPRAFDIGQLLDTRERRRIVGDYTITILDAVNERTYADTISQAYSLFDSHGYTVDPYFALASPQRLRVFTPYRSLLPQGLDGLLVSGLGVSAHRDVLPVIRMQADMQNQGYAAGVAAALAVRAGVSPRNINVRLLQQHLVQVGCLPATVLTDTEASSVDTARLMLAVDRVKTDYQDVAILLANPERALPLLRQALADAQDPANRLVYAHVLAIMGDASGVDVLIDKLNTTMWDSGWKYRAMGQYGPNMSRVDSLILALGRARDRRATSAILAKLAHLGPESDFSHVRAVALALETLRDPAAAGPLAALLSKDGMCGHTVLTLDDAEGRELNGSQVDSARDLALREIMLARALYRCGDLRDLGKQILERYTKDLRGHFARHATAVLAAK